MSRCADCGTPAGPGDDRCPRCRGALLPERGRGRANKVDCLGIALLVLVVFVALALVIPATTAHPQPAYRAQCKIHLRQIALACRMYTWENDGFLPDSLDRLGPDYITDRRMLLCPRAADRSRPSYVLVPGLRAEMPDDFILAYEVSLDNHEGAGRSVAFLDTHVEWWPADRDAELRRRLAEQAERLRAPATLPARARAGGGG